MLAGLFVLDGAHRDRTVGAVGAGGDDLGVPALALDELEGELAFLEVAPGQDLGRGDLVGDAELVRIRLVAVVELRLVGALQHMLCLELALAVVGDGRLDGVGLPVVGDAVVGVALDLAQRVGVLAGLFVLDGAHRDLAVGGVLAGGDDLGVLALALDELEGELAFLEVAAGQVLGRGDLIGDAGALGGHVVDILEGRLLGALQLVLDAEGTVAVVRDRGHDGVLGGAVGNAVLDGAGLGLAQRVGVFAGLGVRDGVHHDLAVGIVDAGSGNNVTFDELKAELAGHKAKLTPGQNLSRGNLTGDAGVLGARLVGIGELRLVGVLQLMLCHKLALAVVGDGRLDGVGLAVVSDAIAGVARGFAQRVGVLAGLFVLDGAHRDLAVGGVGAGSDDIVTLDELEGELAFLEVAPGQDLGRGDLVGDAELVRIRLVGVGERSVDLCDLSRQRAGSIDGHFHGDLRNVIAVGNAAQLALDLADLIGVLARLVVGDLAEVDSRVALVRSRDCGRRHRGAVPGRRGELKLKLIGIRPAAALEHLGQAKAGLSILGIHRCRRYIKADLAVIAQANVNLCGVVVPLGIEHVGRGTGGIVTAHAHLGGMELVNKGKACGSLFK